MDDQLNLFSQQYAATLEEYLAQGQEAALAAAYQLGRKALARGLGLLNVAKLHQEAWARLSSSSRKLGSQTATLKRAETFLIEALSPFEATHRGFRESTLQLARLNETLSERNLELAAMNRNLQTEIAQRKRTEKALRESEEHYRILFDEACQMQENLRNLSRRVLRVQEEERKRISRELHDEVGQALTAINVHLAVLDKSDGLPEDQLRNKISDARRLLEETMETVHGFSRELRPATLDDLGLLPALRGYVRAFAERTSVRTCFSGCRGLEKMGSEQKVVVYRVAQESLTNVAKHAQATRVQIKLRNLKHGVVMEIRDNGKSFSVEEQLGRPRQKRLGLLGIQERVRLVNGDFAIQSKPGKGTTVRVQIPLD